LRSLSVEERIEKMHVNAKRAEIIVGGVYLLKRILERFNIPKVTVSEGDNLLGYVKKKIYGESYL
jgi:exopolyphosphatase/pppGpp-phosphohydrolase